MTQISMLEFVIKSHGDQKRKYTGEPYWKHLIEVAGIVATVDSDPLPNAIALGHDLLEDTEVEFEEIAALFGSDVADGIKWLTDTTDGNRARRKAQDRLRLSAAPGGIQTIKVADMISNTSTIVQHDPNFAKVYIREKIAMLNVLHSADRGLRNLAYRLVGCVPPIDPKEGE